MDRRLLDYLPPVLREVMEMRAVNGANEPEIAAAWDGLEGRKARIKAMWNRDMPYTVPWLKSWLDSLCGAEGHKEAVSGYVLEAELDYDALPDTDAAVKEIAELLSSAIPANMLLRMSAVANGAAQVWAAAAAAGAELADGAATEYI